MTHLKVEQSTGTIEQVDKSVIAELYESLANNTLDLSSNLLGRIHTDATYQEYITYIRAKFPDLYITCDKYYVKFNDPAFLRACARLYGDGVGMTMEDFLAVTDNSPLYAFNGNSDIVDMSEFKYFTNMPGDPNDNDLPNTGIPLSYISNLRTIEFPNLILRLVRHQGYISQENTNRLSYTFYKTENIQSAHLPNNIKSLRLASGWTIMDLRYCTNLESFYNSGSQVTEIYLPMSIKALGSRLFAECSNLKKVVVLDGGTQNFTILNDLGYDIMFTTSNGGVTLDLPSNTTLIHRQMFNGNKVSTFILRAVTPPVAIDDNNSTTTTGMSYAGSIDLYVPDESINTYQLNSVYSGFNHIYGLSQLPSDYSPAPASSNT